MIRQVVTYSSETWTLAAKDENNLRVFERQVLRKVFGPVNIDNIWRMRNNMEIDNIMEGAGILTYLLTPWCRVLLEKLAGLQLVKKFPAFYGTRRFITAFTGFRHPSLSWASPIQSPYPQPTSWRSILILSTHLRLGLRSGLFPSGFPTRNLYAPSPPPYEPHAQPIYIY